ncbi:MAG: exopolysaccharide biosynthesis protein [Oligoflexales bacterium]
MDKAPINGGKLSSELSRLRELCGDGKLPLRTLVESMSARSHGLLTLFFALPFLLPIPVPGLSIIFGLIIFAAGLSMAVGKKPYLPNKLLDKEISGRTIGKILEKAASASKTVEKFVKPRGNFIASSGWIRPLNGLIIATCGFFLALPLPPGTNFPPAIAIVLLSMGSLEEDAVLMILGYCVFAMNVALFGGILLFGANGIRMMMAL